jgi:hypothetical protein
MEIIDVSKQLPRLSIPNKYVSQTPACTTTADSRTSSNYSTTRVQCKRHNLVAMALEEGLVALVLWINDNA